MKRILDIGHADFRIFLDFKHKGMYFWFWLFILPTVFTYFTGAVTGRASAAPTTRRPAVFVVNDDTNFLGRVFVEELSAQNMQLVDATNRHSAAGTIRVPGDFTSRVLQGEKAHVEFLKRGSPLGTDVTLIELRLVRALIAINGQVLAATQTNAPGTLTEKRLREVRGWPPAVALETRFAGRKPVPKGFSFSVPASLVMYVLLSVVNMGGANLRACRQSGVLKRFLACPVRRIELVLGKIYGLVLLGAVLIAYFLLQGKFLYRINLGANFPAVALTLLVFAWVAASLGVLAGSITVAQDRIGGICILVSLGLAALGGCWYPLELSPPTFRMIASCLPTGWALEALNQLISFGSGIGAVVKPLALLVAFGCAANFLAARWFRA